MRVHDVLCKHCETVIVSGVKHEEAKEAYDDHAALHGIRWNARAQSEKPQGLDQL